MIEFNKYPGVTPEGKAIKITIASGPVIIEEGKVALVKHGADDGWKFPGGKLRDDFSPIENAKQEVREELGLEVELSPEPFIVAFNREKDGVVEYVILLHYFAKRVGGAEPQPGRDVREFAWIPIKELPEDCMPNIKAAVEVFSRW